MEELNYIEVNRALWDAKTAHHIGSAFYNMDGFLRGDTSLNSPELELLGNVAGKTVLHLQCHFGQDSMSLSRMGAKVTGVDFSGEAIDKARSITAQLGLDTSFVCTDIYSLPGVLDGQYDIVFTSYGTIGWLPDMQKWAQVVSRYVKPGGRFIIAEFHPVVWMFNGGFSDIQYSYFNRETIVETQVGTYADKGASIEMTEIGWNHDLSEVMQNLINAGLCIDDFREYDWSPYNCFSKMVEVAPGQYQVQGMEGKLPLMYTLSASK